MKRSRKIRFTTTRIVIVFFVLLASSSVSQAQFGERPLPEDSSDLELTQAREKAKSAKKKYEIVKKLNRRGSASQKELRDSKLLKGLAMLELSNLVSPELEQQNALMRAKLVFNYRSQELELTKRLYQRGSASQLAYQRAKTAQELRNLGSRRLKAFPKPSEKFRSSELPIPDSSRLKKSISWRKNYCEAGQSVSPKWTARPAIWRSPSQGSSKPKNRLVPRRSKSNSDLLVSAVSCPPFRVCLLYTSPSPRDRQKSRMPSSA